MTTWEDLCAAGRIRTEVDIGLLTTYRLGGPAAYAAEPTSADEFSVVVEGAIARSLPILMLGRGSNVVVADRGFEGLVIRLAGVFRDVAIDERGVATAGAAAALPQLARTAAHAGFGGVEFYVGIPGSVGGAVTMNAGFLDGETRDVLIDATVVDLSSGESTTRTNAQLAFSYRNSSISPMDAVLHARFRLTEVDTSRALERMKYVTRWRKEHQPGGTYNAGSVFKNPSGDHAGRVIDQLGLKGLTIGAVSVSERHANFFVASDRATSQDVFNLVQAVQLRVRDETGIELEPEIRFLGSFAAPDVPS